MRWLKILVGVMGVMIIVGTVALVVALVQRMGEATTRLSAPEVTSQGSREGGLPWTSTDLSLRQPPGTRIGQIAALEGRLAVWVERPDGARILLVDPRSGRMAGEIRLGE
ncbi:DUF6476 family protein [Pseudoroseomonas sp. WGS1072]|uniref:DUF6476 family protein n=1 Tax=Roseomonas sp. WGS1072 TaxID=3366816 RepID=UPI003BF1BB09